MRRASLPPPIHRMVDRVSCYHSAGEGFSLRRYPIRYYSKQKQTSKKKLGSSVLAQYHDILMHTTFVIAPEPDLSNLALETRIIGAKDAHVLAESLAVHAPYLLSLDKLLVLRVNEAGIPVRALSPGTFIQDVLPDHPALPRLRE